MSSQESRKDPRRKILNLTVRYKSATVAEFVEDYSYDISRGGLFIKTTKPFPTGTLLKFEVRIGEEQTVIDGVGRVAWRRERTLGANKPAGMGIKFIRIADECVSLIQKAVDQHEGADGQFEEGAREQGVFLSEPPVNLRTTDGPATDTPAPVPRMFPSSSAAPGAELDDPGDQSMLFQSSELLKAAMSKVSPSASPREENKHPEEKRAENKREAARGEETASETAESRGDAAREDAESRESAAPREDVVSHAVASESEESTTESPPEIVSATTTSEAPSVPGASNRPKTSARRKNPKKKKKKFNYTSLPAPKTHTNPPASNSSQPPVTSEPQASVSAQPFPTAQPKSGSNAWLWALAAVLIGGVLVVVVTKRQANTPDTAPASVSQVNVEPQALAPSQLGLPAPTASVTPNADEAENVATDIAATAAPSLTADNLELAPSVDTGANATSALADQPEPTTPAPKKQPRRTKKATVSENVADAPEKPTDPSPADSPQGTAAEAESKTTAGAANEPRPSPNTSVPSALVSPAPTSPAPAAPPAPAPIAPAPSPAPVPPPPTPTPTQ